MAIHSPNKHVPKKGNLSVLALSIQFSVTFKLRFNTKRNPGGMCWIYSWFAVPYWGIQYCKMDGDKYMHPHLGMYGLKQSFGSLYAHICIHTHARVIRAYVIYSHLHLKNTQVHKYTIQSSMYLYTWNQFLSLSL